MNKKPDAHAESVSRVLLGVLIDVRDSISGVLAFFFDLARKGIELLGRNVFDIVVAVLFGLFAAIYATWQFNEINFSLLSQVNDVWFDADSFRIIDTHTDRLTSRHYRTTVHPLFSLLASTPMILFSKLGFSQYQVIMTFIGSCSALFGFVCYFSFRALKINRPGSAISTFLMLSTSASLFGFPRQKHTSLVLCQCWWR